MCNYKKIVKEMVPLDLSILQGYSSQRKTTRCSKSLSKDEEPFRGGKYESQHAAPSLALN